MDLQELGFMQSHIWANLYEVNVSRNMITNIDVLTYFPNLRVIDAQNNYIQEVNLYLPQLTSLNLSHNYLTNFPLLENMNKLRYLNCNYNQIVSFQEVEIDFTPNIQTLELQGNQIWFDSPMDFESFVLMLQKLQSLKSLNVDENPFFLPENLKIFTGINVKENLTRRLKKLQYFNSDDMDSVQQQMEKEKIYENIQATNSFSSTATAEPTKVSKKKSKPPPDLNTLLDNLEKANSHPSRALDHLKNLALNADEIVLKINIVEQNFAPDQDDS